MRRFEGKVALVTGASSGLGKAIARRFAQEGASVVCASNATEELAAAVAELAADTGAKLLAVPADVSVEADVKRAVDAAIAEYGRLDVAVNNAGVCQTAKLTDVTPEILDTLLGVHVKGLAFGLKYQIPAIAQSTGGAGGCILAMSSCTGSQVSSTMAEAGFAVYAASKAAIEMLVQYGAAEAAAHGIRVNAIAPGAFQTSIYAAPGPDSKRWSDMSKEEFDDAVKGIHLLGRGGQPEEVAALAAFLASAEASFMTGSVIPIDGGYKLVG